MIDLTFILELRCWWCRRNFADHAAKQTAGGTSDGLVWLEDPLDVDQPLMHEACYWKSQDIFY